MIPKPKLSVRVTALNLVEGEIELRSKLYTKANGLKSISIDGVSDTTPFYGIISRAGSVVLIDKEGWLKKQSDDNVLPDISIEIILNDIVVFDFVSESDISYTAQNKTVTISLTDTITSLQDKKMQGQILFIDTDGLSCFLNLCSILNIKVSMDDFTKKYLQSIYIEKMPIDLKNYWDILNQFAYAVSAIFYKIGKNYYLKKLKE